jgi:hypothetical protein
LVEVSEESSLLLELELLLLEEEVFVELLDEDVTELELLLELVLIL